MSASRPRRRIEDREEGALLDRTRLLHAVDLQARTYRLVLWLDGAVKEGFVGFEALHGYTSMPAAAEAWLGSHRENLPPEARPRPGELREYAAFLATYVTNSFVLVEEPGRRLYTPDGHCLCPSCAWLVDLRHLQVRKVTPADKRRARKMRMVALRSLAASAGVVLSDVELEGIVDDPRQREDTALLAYGVDLLKRMDGSANGPAVLALWRDFAWTATAPRRAFRLTAPAILAAEERLLGLLRERAFRPG